MPSTPSILLPERKRYEGYNALVGSALNDPFTAAPRVPAPSKVGLE